MPIVLFLLLGSKGIVKAQQDGSIAPSPYGKIVREIRIVGLRITDESIVRSQLASHVGNPYTRETKKLDYRWLDRLDVFASIRESTSVVGNEVILTIHLQEFPPVVPFPTLNITEENGASGGMGARLPSLMHRAIALSGSAKFGGLTEIGMSLQAPLAAAAERMVPREVQLPGSGERK